MDKEQAYNVITSCKYSHKQTRNNYSNDKKQHTDLSKKKIDQWTGYKNIFFRIILCDHFLQNSQ